MKLDILAIVAHPDDVELSFGGTLLAHQKQGYKTGILDLTKGELGTRGTPEIRAQEAKDAAEILQLSVRENLGLPDGFFENNKENQIKIAEQIRRFKPKLVITNAIYDRHPDHTRGAQLVETACFIAGLKAVKTAWDGEKQDAFRPDKLYFSIQSIAHEPDILVDISDVIEERRAAIHAFKSQFFDPNSKEPETFISSEGFMTMLDARSREWGHRIGVKYAEGFKVKHFLGVKSLFDLV
ncbi:bacillithiol biosynthesis deacetylase BshB1 [Ekhidna lutea]|uniref:Bacillithiol biosynthesis deacetylase BshB1 n=1 Tax=Ekhidna lutea TaxID=447679 RepID=A0A239LF34_EKHLU|nr:bacillithiol biosynthesis deacetylase BshB1 [Ekhidna lutea]SNT28463.1 bacillithiol biosynthesis deacetylase BshB1 [Ekhidna lutea]